MAIAAATSTQLKVPLGGLWIKLGALESRTRAGKGVDGCIA